MSLGYKHYLFLNIPKFIMSLKRNKNHFYVQIHKYYLLMISYFLYKDINSKFKQLIDMTCVDYFLKEKRFNLIYQLLTIYYHQRIFLKFFVTELESINSLMYIFPNISWYEREVWDLFGIYFANSKHLRRLLLDYGFIGHPFRKDFPLTGFTEVAYSYFFSNVVQKKVNLSQSFRRFETFTVWNNLNSIHLKNIDK